MNACSVGGLLAKRRLVVAVCFLLLRLSLVAQTFEISPQSGEAPPAPSSSAPAKGSSPRPELGWGSSIEVARQARAAEDALRKGNYGAAMEFARRAAEAAPQDTHLWFLLGYAARLRANYALSVNAFQRGLRANPNSMEGLSGLAQTYVVMGRPEEAKKILLQVLAANPRRPNDLNVAGELFLRSGDSARALQLLQRSEAMQPSSRTELLLALAYQKNRQPGQAKKMLARAQERDPRNPEILRAVAGYHREMKELDQAIAALKQIPNPSADVLGELGYTCELAGQRREAAQYYAQAAQKSPKQLSLQLAAASSHVAVNELEEALKFAERASAIDAGHYRVRAIRAEIFKQQGRAPEAIREYIGALEAVPEGPQEGNLHPIRLRMSLADLYRATGDESSARKQFETALEAIRKFEVQGPERAEFLRLRGALKANLNDIPGADSDLKEALSLAPDHANTLLQYGSVQWRLGRKEAARQAYAKALKVESNNPWALIALGYLARDMGDIEAAEVFFRRMAASHPADHAPHLALGDMYTALRRFPEAQEAYERAYRLAPGNPMIVAGGANAGIEAHQFELAERWLKRATARNSGHPYVMRERERYLTWTGNYAESARVGYQVIRKLPKDRDAVVYLGYDLLHLGRYDELLELASRYFNQMPDEPDLPLLAGYVYKHGELLHEAHESFSETLRRDPKVVTAYVNRGYVLNDLQNAEDAANDFEEALKLEPDNGEAHLGLAYSHLELRHPNLVLEHVEKAEKILGESGATHLARATAYRQQGRLSKAEREYRAAMKFRPDDLNLELALAETLYHLRRYSDSFQVLGKALRLSPDDPFIYARMAHAQAQLKNTPETLRYVEEAERRGGEQAGILLNTGNALLELGNRDAAMERFTRALDAPDSDRIESRLAIARAMQREGEWEAAREQVSLAFAESRIGEASPITTAHLLQAGDLFLRMQDFELAERMFQRARAAGAPNETTTIALANTYLARGDTQNAEAELAGLGSPSEFQGNYDYMLAQANLFRQRREDVQALTTFARAQMVSGEDTTAARELQELAGQEGLRINDRLSLLSDLSVAPVFEDATIYGMDARLFGGAGTPAAPSPRYTLETLWTNHYRIHQDGLPTISGFFQMRNARGRISLPAQSVIVDRNTYDYSFNGGLNPVLRLGTSTVSFHTGLQYTFRRDRQSPLQMNQNLFRQFVYFSTNSFFNWISVSGYGIHESGPFTQSDIRSRDLTGRLEFRVGRPWGRTSLITGYWVRGLLFRPVVREWFSTSSYAGIEHRFGETLRLRATAEYIRGWRVQDRDFVLGQALRPALDFTYQPARHWTIDGTFSFSRGMGIRDYDNVQSGIFVTYVRPLRRVHEDESGALPIEYPLRLSVGLQQQQFFHFPGGRQATYLPVVRLTLF
jgi:tetratricopeptide (TPR) repeat protein